MMLATLAAMEAHCTATVEIGRGSGWPTLKHAGTLPAMTSWRLSPSLGFHASSASGLTLVMALPAIKYCAAPLSLGGYTNACRRRDVDEWQPARCQTARALSCCAPSRKSIFLRKTRPRKPAHKNARARRESGSSCTREAAHARRYPTRALERQPALKISSVHFRS